MANNPYVSVSISTIYEFTAEAVDEILLLYNEQKWSGLVECLFDPRKQMFVLEGDRAHTELAYMDFMKLLQKVTTDAVEKKRITGKTAPIHRSKLTYLIAEPIIWTEDVVEEPKVDDSRGVISSANFRYTPPSEEVVDHTEDYLLVEIWEPGMDKQDFIRMLRKGSENRCQEELSRVCNCAVFVDWEKRIVKVGANNLQTIGRVVRKLEKLEEVFKRGYKCRIIHLVHPEEKKKFDIKLLSLKNQEALWGTTLLPADSKWYRCGPDSIFLVRLREYDIPKVKFTGCSIEIKPVHTSNKGEEFRGWEGYAFEAWGSSDFSALAEEYGLTKSQRETITDRQVHENVDPEDYLFEFFKPGTKVEQLEGLRTRGKAVDVPPPDQQKAIEDVPPEDKKIEPEDGPHDPNVFRMGKRPDAIVEEAVQADGPGIAKRRPKIREENTRSELEVEENQALSTTTNPGDMFPLDKPPAFGGRTDPKDETKTNENQFPQGLDLIFGPRPGSFDTPPSETPVLGRTIRKPRERKPPQNDSLILLEDNESQPVEQKQAIEEKDTREIQHTMGQKKPSKKVLHDGLDESLKLGKYNAQKLYRTLNLCFEHARHAQGEVKFEATLGRVILESVPKEIAKSSIDWTEFEGIVTNTPEIQTIFTDRLTRDCFDAEFLCDLKLSKAERIFSPVPLWTKVTYEFYCTYNEDPHCLVINAETFEANVFSSTEQLGTVFWICPLRSWDATIQLTHRRVVNKNAPVFRTIINTLYCSGESENPDIGFLATDDKFSVDKVFCKREARYSVASTDISSRTKMELSVTQVHELILQRHRTVHGQYRAVSKSKEYMKKHGLFHYVFSIVPVEIDMRLKENLYLEIGEEVDWTTQELLGEPDAENGILPPFVKLLNTIIKKTDDVGFHNYPPKLIE